jgi:lysophospholipase L1-like esterase
MKYKLILFVLIFSYSGIILSQDPHRFQKEIDTIDKRYAGKVDNHKLIIFTGSSSVRRWENIRDFFPGKNIINTGFGGSQMSDLIFYSDSVITKYKPVRVFIYEGDNDINAGEKAEDVIKETKILVRKLTSELPKIRIVIISVKPSPSRWALKDEYLKLNSMFKQISAENKNVSYVDVWYPLINEQGRPKGEVFISDSLHINRSGYDIWAGIIKRYLK